MKRPIVLTLEDRARLEDTLFMFGHPEGALDGKAAQRLIQEIERAEIVAAEHVPPDVVTMNSKVFLRDIDTGETMTYRLVFPKYADVDEGAISVLAPVGMGILGYAVGDVVEWPVPSGMRRLSIEKVLYQPEAAGDFHL